MVRDLISIDFAPEQRTLGVIDYVYRNVERAYTAGADASVRFKAHRALSLDGAYAYLWTRDDASGDPLANRPAHTITLSALLELGRLSSTLRYRFVSSAFAGRIDDVMRHSPSFGLLDARVAYQCWPALSVFAGVLDASDARRRPLDVTDTRPAQGRQFYLGLSGDTD